MEQRHASQEEEIDFKGIINKFIEKNEHVAFVPCSYFATTYINNYQTNTNRRLWHIAAGELDVHHLTMKIWSYVSLCGTHGSPLRRVSEGATGQYDSDYECDYEDSEEYTSCYRDDEPVTSTMRTVIIFNKEGAEKIKGMDNNKIRDYLVNEGVLYKQDGKYWYIRRQV